MKKALLASGLVLAVAGSAASFASAASSSAVQKGRILLQVESKGEAWYVDPSSGERSYLGKPNDALGVMKKLGIGISDANLEKIQIADKNLSGGTDSDSDGLSDVAEAALGSDKSLLDTDGDGQSDKTEALGGYDPNSPDSSSLLDTAFAKKQSGKILLQVEKNGEAWYVNPTDNKRYFLGRPADAFNVMRSLGLGVSNNNLNKIKTRGQSSDTASSSASTVSTAKNGKHSIPGNATSTRPARPEGFGTSTPPSGQRRPDDLGTSTRPMMPDEDVAAMAAACSGKSAGGACSVSSARGNLSGICQSADGSLSCLPERPENATSSPFIR